MTLNKESMEKGDLVTHKTGFTNMVVIEVLADVIRCRWFDHTNSTFKSDYFYKFELTKSERTYIGGINEAMQSVEATNDTK